MNMVKAREAFWKAAYGPTPMLEGAVRFIEAGLLAAKEFLQEPCERCETEAERMKQLNEAVVYRAQERTSASPTTGTFAQPEGADLVQRMWYAYDGARGGCLDGMTAALAVAAAHHEREKQQALAEQEERLLWRMTDEEWDRMQKTVSCLNRATRYAVDVLFISRRTKPAKTVEEKVEDLLVAWANCEDKTETNMLSEKELAAEICALLKERHD